MSSVNLVKPSSRTDAVIVSSGLGTGGTDFYIKVQRSQLQFGSPLEDVTGDGDNAPCVENNGYIYGAARISGFMVSGQAIGLLKLVSANPVAEMEFWLANDHVIKANWMVESIAVSWDRRGRYVGIEMSLQKQATAVGAESLAETA